MIIVIGTTDRIQGELDLAWWAFKRKTLGRGVLWACVGWRGCGVASQHKGTACAKVWTREGALLRKKDLEPELRQQREAGCRKGEPGFLGWPCSLPCPILPQCPCWPRTSQGGRILIFHSKPKTHDATPQTHRDLPASVCWVLRLKTFFCTMPSLKNI